MESLPSGVGKQKQPNNYKTSIDFKGFNHWSKSSNNILQGVLWHCHLHHSFCA